MSILPSDPVLRAFALWDDDCAIYAGVHGVTIAEAARRLLRQRQVGREPIGRGE